MPKKRLGSEQIVTKLRQLEVLQSQGKSVAAACKEAGLAALSGTTSVTGTTDILRVLLERLHQAVDARHQSEALEALLHFLPSHFLHLGDAGNNGKRIDRYGSLLHGVALRLGVNYSSPRLEESNSNLTANFYINRAIPIT
jgi:hypothetical protein